jgi:hypothetical protein
VGFRPFMVHEGEVLIRSDRNSSNFEESLQGLKYLMVLKDSGCGSD